ncbi:MAG: sigma-70 family RNA polymerase sigma factor [Acidobacteriota bacterium]|nr:sigma-70 family RNA polymerase sigma factor [Acidobacteriota bacterium]
MRIGTGDREAERELVARYAPPVERLLRAAAPDRWTAEDLLQETMASVIARLRRKPLDDPAALEGYVKQTARKLILARHRKSRPSQPIPLEMADPRPEQLAAMLHDEKIARMRIALSRLRPPRYRELLERFYLFEESKEAICADLGLSALHFNRVLFRARRRLRTELERDPENRVR